MITLCTVCALLLRNDLHWHWVRRVPQRRRPKLGEVSLQSDGKGFELPASLRLSYPAGHCLTLTLLCAFPQA